jgi:hypothetical protein
MNEELCVACGNKSLKELSTIEGYIKGSYFKVLSCLACESNVVSPHKTGDKVYELIYKNRYTAPGYSRYAQYAEDVLLVDNPLKFLSKREEMYHGVATEIGRIAKKGDLVLDVGCG